MTSGRNPCPGASTGFLLERVVRGRAMFTSIWPLGSATETHL